MSNLDFEEWWEKEGLKLPEMFESVANAFKEIAEKAWIASRILEESLRKDALLYRFLRDEDNWGEDSEPYTWGALGECSHKDFDNFVNRKMKMNEECK